MKNKNKVIILLGTIAIALGIGKGIVELNNKEVEIPQKIEAPKIQAYNYSPANILDNVFVQDGMNIIPFIFKNEAQTVSKDTVASAFKNKGLTITNTISKTTLGTGTQIKANNGKTYTVLVYGDVDGNGKVNLIDAQRIIMHHKGTRKLSGIYFIAGNVSNNNNVVNLIDAQKVVMLKKGTTTKLVTNEPVSLKEADKTAPVITLKGSAAVEVIQGTSYTDAGASATDNYDGTVKVTTSGSVNTSKVGTYTITYTAVDSNGNKATKTRTVKVVADTIVSISMKTNPTKTIYEYGETTLNLSGANINVKMKSGKVNTVAITSSMISSYSLTSLGTKTITVNYSGLKTTFNVTVKDTKKPVITLNSSNTINVVVNTSFTYPNVTAKDNYNGTVNVTRQGSVNVNALGKYTLTYTAKDSSNNTATASITVNVIDKVKSITVNSGTIKTNYEYGEASTLNLSSAKMNVTMYSNKVETKAITASMIKPDLTLPTSGSKTYTVTYSGQTATFTVKVLNPIQSLEFKEELQQNITTSDNRYNTTVGTFKLGTISAAKGTDITPLKLANLKTTIKILNNGVEQATDGLSISYAQENGKIVMKGEATKSGIYKITPYWESGSAKATTSQAIELKVKSVTPVFTSLTIKNESNNIADKVNLYLEEGTNIVKETDNCIYTRMPVTFLDQDGDEIAVSANDIKYDGADAQLKIELPTVNSESDPTAPITDAINVLLYDKDGHVIDGTEVSNDTAVKFIGFAINVGRPVSKEDIKNHSITLKYGEKTINLPLNVVLKEITTLVIERNETIVDLTDSFKPLKAPLNTKTLIGTVTTGEDESLITSSDITFEVTKEAIPLNDYSSYINITLEESASKKGLFNIYVEVKQEGNYEITPKFGSIGNRSIRVKCIVSPIIDYVSINNDEKITLVKGEAGLQVEFKATSNLHPDGEPIKRKDITVDSQSQRISYKFLDATKNEITDENSETVVAFIELKANDDADTSAPVENAIYMILFKDKINEFSDIIFPTITIQEPQVQP